MPGVPPMDSIKRALKGMFKRGKKNKPDTETPQEQRPPSSSAMPAAAAATTSAAPPQLPPVQNASPLHDPAAEDASKPVPPTHPLSTGPHAEPQEAVPQEHDSLPKVTSDTALAPAGAPGLVGKQEESQVVPTTAIDGAKDEAGAAENTTPPQLASHPAEGTNSTAFAATENIDSAAPATKTDSAIGAQDQLVTDVDKENTQAPTDERVAAMHVEPPPIKAVTAAPGMSATSGPLEDFPEGGDLLHDEEHSS